MGLRHIFTLNGHGAVHLPGGRDGLSGASAREAFRDLGANGRRGVVQGGQQPKQAYRQARAGGS